MNMEASNSSNSMFFGARGEDQGQMTQHPTMFTSSTTAPAAAAAAPQKKKRNLPGTPNPDAEVIALSPKSLMATNRFICEVCNKGFQREQNLQLHRRGHNLPWKLKKKTTNEVIKRKVYLCPEPTCIHHDPSRALGDLTGIKKHYSRKHGEKKYKCDKCSKRYAVQSDWKAHSKTCGTREYRCDCGTLFSRRDSFITHRAFCDALAQESERHPSSISSHIFGNNPMHLNLSQAQIHSNNMLRLGSGTSTSGAKLEQLSSSSSLFTTQPPQSPYFMPPPDSNQGFQELQNKSFHGLMQLPDHLQANTSNSPSAASNLFNLSFYPSSNTTNSISNSTDNSSSFLIQDHQFGNEGNTSIFSGNNTIYNTSHDHQSPALGPMSATALLQKAAQMGSTTSNTNAALLRGLGSSNTTSSITDANKFGRRNFNTENEHQQLEGLTNPFANGNYGSHGPDHHQHNNNFAAFGGNTMRSQMDDVGAAGKMHHNVLQSTKGPSGDGLTLDFLGIGGGRARNSSIEFSQRDHQAATNNETTSVDNPRLSSLSQVRHPFGNPKLQ
ncbi:hypothetical protein ACET3Z_002374 [Daucus carota]